jgi:copper chaperone CopZ
VIGRRTDMSEIRVRVRGMKCAGCAKRVDDALKTVPGVTSVKVDLKGAEVVVTGDTTEDAVRKKVVEIGYKVD